MLDLWQDQTLGGGGGSELVSYHASGRNALPSKQPRQQALSGLCVAAGLGDFVENIAVLIDCAPQPTFLAIDRNDDLVQMPDVAAGGEFYASIGRRKRHRISSPIAGRSHKRL